MKRPKQIMRRDWRNCAKSLQKVILQKIKDGEDMGKYFEPPKPIKAPFPLYLIKK